MQPSISTADWLRLLLLSVIWGGSFLFIGIAIRELPLLTLVAGRVLVAALALHAFLLLTGRRLPRSGPVVLAFLVQGALSNAIPFTLLAWGQSQTSAALASILNATTPLWTVVLAHVLTRDERMTGGRVAGVITGFAGVAVMMGVAALGGLGAAVLGQLACLGATFAYGLAGIAGRRFRELGVAPIEVATGQLTASSAMMLPLALLIDRPWTLPVPSGETMLAFLALALVCTAFAYTLFFRILEGAGATGSSLVTFLVPPSAIVFAVLVLGETLEWKHAAGLLLIAGGLALIDGRPLSWLRAKRRAAA